MTLSAKMEPHLTEEAMAAAAAAAADDAPPAAAAPQHKKRRVERREKLRKTALCKHFDKPGGCPFPNCKFAHGRCEYARVGLLVG